jgi:CRISPR-associated exonuclease Cas4
LVEEAYGRRPPHGLIKYADKVLAVDFTPELEAELSSLLDDIRADAGAEDVSRSHNLTTRCWACGFRDQCEESLV